MIKATFEPTKETQKTIKRLHVALPKFSKMISKVVDKYATRIMNRTISHYLTGAALNVRSNRLRSSITRKPSSGVSKLGGNINVSIGTNVWYGKLWEKGFTSSKSIQSKSKIVFGANIASSKPNARPFLQPSFDDYELAMKRELENLWENLAK